MNPFEANRTARSNLSSASIPGTSTKTPANLPFAEGSLQSGSMDLLTCELPGVKKLRSGKVREVFDLGDSLLLVATDRISAYDCILPNAIPHKGTVLTQLSKFWFEKLDFVPNHLAGIEPGHLPDALLPYAEILHGRSMIVAKATPLPVECVVRGYLAGSGWKEYQASGTVGGHKLPAGLQQAEKLPESIFTPSTKAESGHDENITWNQCRQLLGDEIAAQVRDYSIELYEHGRAYAAKCGILIADTKFEFGMVGNEIVLIDECLTPDSSRFWPEVDYQRGTNPPSYDKQFVRDYLETLDWNKTPPAPELPSEIVAKTSLKYIEAFEQLSGMNFTTWDHGAAG